MFAMFTILRFCVFFPSLVTKTTPKYSSDVNCGLFVFLRYAYYFIFLYIHWYFFYSLHTSDLLSSQGLLRHTVASPVYTALAQIYVLSFVQTQFTIICITKLLSKRNVQVVIRRFTAWIIR